MIASNKLFLMIIISDNCHYCKMYEPIVEEVANEYEITIKERTDSYENIQVENEQRMASVKKLLDM